MNGGDEYTRKSGQIPAFGDWENAIEMPITRYFDCARQAGLPRCTCSGECPGVVFQKPKEREVSKLGFSHSDDMIYQSRNRKKHRKRSQKPGNLAPHKSPVAVKPVDEDLYKISPELIKNYKGKKKMLGFFSRCIAPCAA